MTPQLSMHTCSSLLTLTYPSDSSLRRFKSMAVKIHPLVSLWFLVTIPVIFWDAAYIFARPRSFEGGDLHWIWKPYAIYQNVDLVYGTEAYAKQDGFPPAQSFLNIIENCMNILYLYYAHVVGWSGASLIGFASLTMTLSKTVLYGANEYFCNYCSCGHNDWNTLFVYWILPNGFWIVVPSICVYILGKDIASNLKLAEVAVTKKKAT
ncbi:hypothetical protein DL96DRAFT_1708975 [Flagelloscypha sp. PMI_526]|nr:hypothetical protein DL96DRAFT_1708975 [Flagelloscypha sp. PMI_526]